MSRESAERALIVSALVVAIVYGYRRLEEASAPGVSIPRLIGSGAPPSFASWATAWGTVFFMLSVAGEFAPGPAGAFAILTAGSCVLANGKQLFADLAKQTGNSSTQAASITTTAPAPAAMPTIPVYTAPNGWKSAAPIQYLPPGG